MDATTSEQPLEQQLVAILGRLAGMSKREAAGLIRARGGAYQERASRQTTLLVVGEGDLAPIDPAQAEELLDEGARRAAEEGRLRIVPESELWGQLGLLDVKRHVHRLYTPAMLAELLGVSVAIIRRWHRRGLIVPAKQVRKLPYFDFQEVATARRLAEMLAAGCSPRVIESQLSTLHRYVPDIDRPLAQLSVIIEGKQILLREGDGLIEPGGQLRFDFEAADSMPDRTEDASSATEATRPENVSADPERPPAAEDLAEAAVSLEEEGRLEDAADMYRAALSAGGPDPEIGFALAELLYRLGDLPAARERYFTVVEQDEDYLEARANLGCVLMEEQRWELAEAAFQGALAHHEDYADVHYHLARLLDLTNRSRDADAHWQAFLTLAPDSPWSESARRRLKRGESDGAGAER